MSMIERLKRMWRIQDRSLDTEHRRIDQMTASREGTAITESEGAAIPPNYLPTGVDEGRPKK